MVQPGDGEDFRQGPAPTCAVEGAVSAPVPLEGIRGKLTCKAPLAPYTWFKTGGPADWLFEPADLEDLKAFLERLGGEIPVMALGLGSNMIVRDGGVPGVVVRLGKAFAGVEHTGENELVCGGGASGILVASTARDLGIAGLEFLRGIPGTVGGFVRMNGGAYGREIKDVVVSAEGIDRRGRRLTLDPAALDLSYRHSGFGTDVIVTAAVLRGEPGEPGAIGAAIERIQQARADSQPVRARTGGSTFANPDGAKAWELIDRAGCRGLRVGQAQVSEKHCNFLINLGGASAADIEALGEEVRRRVLEQSGVELQWEIRRLGVPK
jgi:UDP-N-acetylmuramate dehydrogenase